MAAVILCVALVGACGSGGAPQPSVALARSCQSVSAVLSDGPDPTADPVGYAEAQILPLRQVQTSDRALRSAIDELDGAYEELFSTDGSAAAARAVTEASARLDAMCPGAAP